MGARRPSARLAKIHRNYSVEELARLFNVHKNTIRSWFKQGLKAIDGQRPTLVRGDEVRRFLADRLARAKQTCGPGRIYCLPCRAPKVPAARMADCIVISPTRGKLQGICPDCGRMVYRQINPQRLNEVRGDLDIKFAQAGARIRRDDEPQREL